MKLIISFMLLMFGQFVFAQTLKLRPSLYMSFPYNRFTNSTIPEPLFSTTFTRSADFGVSLEKKFGNYNFLYFKIATFSISNSMRQANDRKPEFIDLVSEGSTLVTTKQIFRLGFGLKKDLLFNSKSKSLFGTIGFNIDMQNNIDTIGSISGFYSSLLTIDKWITTKYNKIVPSFDIGLSHPILNKRKKEIVEISVSYSQSFGLLSQKTLYFRYSGPRYGGTEQQRAIFESKGQAIQIVISKTITLKK